jgi:hypothetical protein
MTLAVRLNNDRSKLLCGLPNCRVTLGWLLEGNKLYPGGLWLYQGWEFRRQQRRWEWTKRAIQRSKAGRSPSAVSSFHGHDVDGPIGWLLNLTEPLEIRCPVHKDTAQLIDPAQLKIGPSWPTSKRDDGLPDMMIRVLMGEEIERWERERPYRFS